MANTSSAKKANRASQKRRLFNVRRSKSMKDAVKEIGKLIREKNVSGAETALSKLYKAVDKAAKGGVVKPNNAARVKSRITKRVAALTK